MNLPQWNFRLWFRSLDKVLYFHCFLSVERISILVWFTRWHSVPSVFSNRQRTVSSRSIFHIFGHKSTGRTGRVVLQPKSMWIFPETAMSCQQLSKIVIHFPGLLVDYSTTSGLRQCVHIRCHRSVVLLPAALVTARIWVFPSSKGRLWIGARSSATKWMGIVNETMTLTASSEIVQNGSASREALLWCTMSCMH